MLNAQVSCYASWRPDPDETYVNVFSVTWETLFLCFSMPDDRCAKDTSTATEHAQNARERT